MWTRGREHETRELLWEASGGLYSCCCLLLWFEGVEKVSGLQSCRSVQDFLDPHPARVCEKCRNVKNVSVRTIQDHCCTSKFYGLCFHVSRAPGGNVFKFGKNVHVVSRMNWLDFGGRRLKVTIDYVGQSSNFMWPHRTHFWPVLNSSCDNRDTVLLKWIKGLKWWSEDLKNET